MTILLRRDTMSSPTGVGDGNLGNKGLLHVDSGRSDLLAETSDLAYFFEEEDFTLLIPINTEASRVVSTIFLASKTLAKNFKNLFTGL